MPIILSTVDFRRYAEERVVFPAFFKTGKGPGLAGMNERAKLAGGERNARCVAVVDISMPGLNGLEVISRLNLLHSKMPVLVVTMRELQVLRRLATGNTNREIATIYGISIKTVDTYRFRLLKKLDWRNNAELSRFAIQNRLIDL